MTDPAETNKEEAIKIPDVLPVLPLKDLVIFPFIIVPLSVSREKSINAVDQALAENRVIMLTAQKDFQNEDPAEDELYRVGTVAIIMRMLKLPDGRIRILVRSEEHTSELQSQSNLVCRLLLEKKKKKKTTKSKNKKK